VGAISRRKVTIFIMHRLRAVALTGRGEPKHLAKIAASVAVIVVILFISHGNLGAAILGGILVASVCGIVDPRISIALALLCLTFYPIIAVAERNAWLAQSPLVGYYAANIGVYSTKNVIDTVTEWAFYLLCIGLVGRLARYVVQEKNANNE